MERHVFWRFLCFFLATVHGSELTGLVTDTDRYEKP